MRSVHLLLTLLALALAAGCGGSNGEDPAADAGRADAGGTTADAGTADGSMPEERWCERVGTRATDFEEYSALLGCLRAAGEPEQVRRAAIDAFVGRVESRGGFPIQTPTELVFVYVASARWDAEDDKNAAEDYAADRRREPIRVAGDFNGWDGAGSALQGEPLGFYHLRLAQVVPVGSRWGYKFVARDGAGADVWFSDPLSRRFDFDGNGRISLVRGGGAVGHLEWMRAVKATALNVERSIYLYLPPGYDSSSDRYPVAYLHDGNNLFDPAQPNAAPQSWQVDAVANEEIAAGRVRPFIAVGIPNNADRMDEYTHVEDDLPGYGRQGGRADDYGAFLVDDLKPLVDARYRTQPGRDQTAILGSSLGGLISYHVALRHPTVFKYVGGFSSTFGWGRLGLQNPTMPELYADTADLGSRGHVYYLDVGGGPPESGECLPDLADEEQRDAYCSTEEMKRTLVAAGYDTFPNDADAYPLEPEQIEIMHWWQPGAPHDEGAWNARLHRALRLFFRP